MSKQGINIIIAGGGTGGHLYPAIAVGQWLSKQANVNSVFYMGSKYGIESEKYKALGLAYKTLPIRGFQRGFSVKAIMKNLLLPFRLLSSWLSARSVFNKIQPDVVLGTGGYGSALPLKVAASKNIPLVLQEQNSFPGLTTRMFSKSAKSICLGFEKANEFIGNKGILTGNPVRESIDKGNPKDGAKKFNLNNDIKTVFLFGGSQGSLFLNRITAEFLSNNSNQEFQLIWQTGPRWYEDFKKFDSTMVRVTPFIEKMENAYAIADLVVSRAGALTLSELAFCGMPSILVPLPSAAGNHQFYNASFFADSGAAEVLEEKQLDGMTLFNTITKLIFDDKKLNKMKESALNLKFPNATEVIGKIVLEAAA